jgi:hypothetical protein
MVGPLVTVAPIGLPRLTRAEPVHPWKLVAPWWRWRRQLADGSAASARQTRPTTQKFNDPKFVENFLKDPQRSLKFDEFVDQVYLTNLVPVAPLSTGPLVGKVTTLFAAKDADGKAREATLVAQGIRKLYLQSHSRFYAVVCELHCDFAGFPSPSVDETCEVGFVVRRRVLRFAKGKENEAASLLRAIVHIQAQLAELDETAPARPAVQRKRAAMVAKKKADGTFAAVRASIAAELTAKRAQLQAWKDDNGVSTVLEGWIPSTLPKIGAWVPVDETPTTTVLDAFFPMYRLTADPANPAHDATGRTIWFGVVPTSAHETEVSGVSRFDDTSAYEIRCFVRRHDKHCPRRVQKPDCDGELIWSRATDVYKLAPHHDLVGTSNHPVTIQMPDLAELAAQASALPFGKFSPVKVLHKNAFKTTMSGMTVASGSVGGPAICFFSIPLITIVAMFVLQIFLPIVMLIFGLWFLLAFKFCIPPSFSIDLGVQAELSAIASVSASASFDVNASSITLPNLTVKTASQVNADLKASVADIVSNTTGLAQSDVSGGLNALANTPLVQLSKVNTEIRKYSDDIKAPLPLGLDLTTGLEWEDRETLMVLT